MWFQCKRRSGPHLDEAFRLTLSLTCSTVFGFASLLPPTLIEMPTVPRRVPRARYSVLIARPRITLHSNKPVNKWPRIGNRTGDGLGHDGRCRELFGAPVRTEAGARIEMCEFISYFPTTFFHSSHLRSLQSILYPRWVTYKLGFKVEV